MTDADERRILTVNTGSSSIKTALYVMRGADEAVALSAAAERIGSPQGSLLVTGNDGAELVRLDGGLERRDAALAAFFDWLEGHPDLAPHAVAHRIVQGDHRYNEHQFVTPRLLADLRALVPTDPTHLPAELDGIEAVGRRYPELPQVVCFDIAFHRDLPTRAKMYGVPRALYDAGIYKHGFHGLSYEYIAHEMRRLDPPRAAGRLIVAHLGSGASVAAIRDGRSVDTSMGFTALPGLVMGTRSGDVDPGVLLYLLRTQRLTPDRLSELLNRRSGLLGVSGLSSDMRDLLAAEPDNPHAAEAVELFCYRARQYVGAYAAALGGVDTLVFTAGIGERSPAVRERICAGLEFMGIALDAERNGANAPVISCTGSTAVVRVIKTNEDLVIARHARDLLDRRTQADADV